MPWHDPQCFLPLTCSPPPTSLVLQRPVALFACWSEEGCATVVAEAERAAASPESCLLVLEGGQVASMRALLVSQLLLLLLLLLFPRCGWCFGAVRQRRFVAPWWPRVQESVCTAAASAAQSTLLYILYLCVQEELVTFIRQVPGGTVIINRLDQVRLFLLRPCASALPVFIVAADTTCT